MGTYAAPTERTVMRPVARIALTLAVLCAALAAPAAASFHFMRIVQVYGGDIDHPDAQYVVLQMCTGGQNFVGGHSIRFFDETGAAVGTPATFTTPMGNAASQAKILIATTSVETLFGVSADLHMQGGVLPAGGKVCFDPPPGAIDCIAWGTYSPSDPTVGNPFSPIFGIEPGEAPQRDLAIVPPPTTLECVTTFDDTDDSAADFDAVQPTPTNNAGETGTETDPALIFFHGFENLAFGGWSFVLDSVAGGSAGRR